MSPESPKSLRAAQRHLPLASLRVLEPACGAGHYLRHLGPGSRGIDRSSSIRGRFAASLAESGAQDIEVLTADLDRAGWSACLAEQPAFEAALLCDVMMHIEHPAAFLDELARSLPPGTPVVLIEWTLPRGALRARLARALPGAREVFTTPKHLRSWRADELIGLFESHGYTLVDSWIHSFEGRLAGRLMADLVAPFWPLRTWLLHSPS